MTDLYENTKTPMEVSSNLSCGELKKLYFDTKNINCEKYKTRLFFGGAEILEQHKLYQYNLRDGFHIQIIKTIID